MMRYYNQLNDFVKPEWAMHSSGYDEAECEHDAEVWGPRLRVLRDQTDTPREA